MIDREMVAQWEAYSQRPPRRHSVEAAKREELAYEMTVAGLLEAQTGMGNRHGYSKTAKYERILAALGR